MAQRKKTKQRRMFRLLPLTITMLSLLLVAKMNELYIGSKALREIYAARDAVAEDKKKEKKADATPAAKEAETKPAAKEDETKPVETAEKLAADVKPADAAASALKPEEVKKAETAIAPKADEAKKREAEGEAKPTEEGKPVPEARTHGTGKSTVKAIEEMKARELNPRYSQTELDLLQNLSKRRDELDQREKDLEIKAKVLDATDKRIADKMNEMKTLKGELAAVLSQYNEKQDAQIKSLVKIYESMKPDEAAAIFNEMDMPILLEVIGKMSERKVAPVLANMSPKKARDVTQELAEKRKKAIPAADVTAAAKP